jgi:hypothetical protein
VTTIGATWRAGRGKGADGPNYLDVEVEQLAVRSVETRATFHMIFISQFHIFGVQYSNLYNHHHRIESLPAKPRQSS